jgi:hypothetical protein
VDAERVPVPDRPHSVTPGRRRGTGPPAGLMPPAPPCAGG